jgi:hypothetical protein
MDGNQSFINPSDLYARLGTARAPIVVDVRRPSDFSAAPQLIVGAFYESPDEIDRWKRDLTGRPPCRRVLRARTRGQSERRRGLAKRRN